MLETIRRTALLCVLAVAVAPLLCADGHAFVKEAQAVSSASAEKFAGLAEAMPADKYTYRPGEGVRSVSEVLLHVAGANYFVSRALGTMPPEGLDLRGLEKSTTDKQEVISKVKMSFDHLQSAMGKFGADDAEKPMKLFGRDTTTRGALTMALTHLSEHLGQLIAYGRVNGVVPPWSN